MALTAKKVYAILKRQISDMEAKLNSPVRYRGTVATADLLPLNPDIGDMYNIESKSVYGEAGMNVAWNGVVWDTMGAPIDMSLYIKSSELADWVKQQNKPTYTAEEVGALPADTKIPSKTSDLQNDSGFLTEIPDNYLSGTDKTLSVSGKAADAKATGDKITELSADISNKLNKNQGSENSGKIAGINESGDIVPMFPVSVDYNEETNCLEFGSDQKMELNKGINLDNTLAKTGYAADAGAVGKITNSLKEDISNKITKFYASSQGETHLADSDNGKIMDMMIYGKSSQDGTPSPENPVEIKSVVNPTVKVCGKNLLDVNLAKANNNVKIHNGVVEQIDSDTRDELQWKIIQFKSNGTIIDYNEVSIMQGTRFGCAFTAVENTTEIVFGLNGEKTDTTVRIPVKLKVGQKYVISCNLLNSAQGSVKWDEMMLEEGSTITDFEPYHEQTVTLPYTLSAIPVESGGNITINGQQYVADYVDVERGKLVRSVFVIKFTGAEGWSYSNADDEKYKRFGLELAVKSKRYVGLSNYIINAGESIMNKENVFVLYRGWIDVRITRFTSLAEFKNFLSELNSSGKPLIVVYALETPEEIDLTPEEIAAFKALATYYPTTNISVNSEQLDGYTVFNYPISMANGWNYVKQQLNDNRDYIYDMDLQSAEAYVNSEYAVALTELEV